MPPLMRSSLSTTHPVRKWQDAIQARDRYWENRER
jgi:hypothetical protein